jgi:hypothetical protein
MAKPLSTPKAPTHANERGRESRIADSADSESECEARPTHVEAEQ